MERLGTGRRLSSLAMLVHTGSVSFRHLPGKMCISSNQAKQHILTWSFCFRTAQGSRPVLTFAMLCGPQWRTSGRRPWSSSSSRSVPRWRRRQYTYSRVEDILLGPHIFEVWVSLSLLVGCSGVFVFSDAIPWVFCGLLLYLLPLIPG